MKSAKAVAIQACTASTVAFSRSGRFRPKMTTRAEKKVRMRSQSIIEPSWFPHTPEIL